MVLVKRVRELLTYHPDTGVFTWRVKRRAQSPVGSVAGKIDEQGYCVIGIDRRKYKAHRLAWLYVHGVWPVGETDHINGIRDDNRIANLRDGTKSLNQQSQRNPRSDNTSGFLGVSRYKRGSNWAAQIRADGKRHFLGYFPTPEAAHAAYVAAKRGLHEGCTI